MNIINRAIIAGGGTGGHLFPGIALGELLKQNFHTEHILFIVPGTKFDLNVMKDSPFNYEIINSPRLTGKIGVNSLLNLTGDMFKSLKKSIKVINKFCPDIIFGLGGYGSFPTVAAGVFFKIKTIMLEQNVIPGKVTKLLAPFTNGVFLQWNKTKQFLPFNNNSIFTGSPYREIMKLHGKIQINNKLNLSPNKKTILVMGGSQGSSNINKWIIHNVKIIAKYKNNIQIIHITGEKDYVNAVQAYTRNGISNLVIPFSSNLAPIYSVSDYAISRAGGGSIAELMLFNIPSLFIPYPYAAENHQFYNAQEAFNAGYGEVISENNLNTELMQWVLKKMVSYTSKKMNFKDAEEIIKLKNANKTIVNSLCNI